MHLSSLAVERPRLRSHRRGGRVELSVERAVLVEEVEALVHRLDEGARAFGKLTRAELALPAAQQDRLLDGEQHGAGDLLGELEHAKAIARRDGAHADLVLIMRFGGAR